MVAVVVLVGLGVWWVGPNLVNLAVFDSSRDKPYVLVDFVRSQSEDVYQARYLQPLAGLLASEGGELLGAYRLAHLVEGSVEDEWAYLNRLQVPRAQDLAQVMTSSPYRLMRDDIPGLHSVQLGSYELPVSNWRPALVVWLVERRTDSLIDPLTSITAALGSSDGRIVWDAPVSALADGMSWNRILVVDFAAQSSAFAWLRHIDMETSRALANARVKRLALAVYVREPGLRVRE
jgi:hypothetical protein